MTAPDERPSATNTALGGMVAWISGKDSTKRGRSPLDGAVGELVSWLTGKGGKKGGSRE
ncbi:hypothetical protein [Tsukamurella spumae]|uniref:Uncharacterized protein n=1 Tax=Tsukamurella spumae TaxID=44753 RepID=A0A846X1I8_9ACTN|nr:hypothetical protein [Tsukamurella spumae]NKY18981.1 hypothetical protein [Tsukamurella spumae]